MDARERRRAIMGVLERAKDPVSGSALAREVGVSRQIVVQDIALLRADGHDIVATNRGYVLQEAPSSPAVPTRLVKVRHGVDHVGGGVVHFQQLAKIQTVQIHGFLHLPAFGTQNVAERRFLQGNAFHQVHNSLIQADLGHLRALRTGAWCIDHHRAKPSFPVVCPILCCGGCSCYCFSACARTFSMVSR